MPVTWFCENEACEWHVRCEPGVRRWAKWKHPTEPRCFDPVAPFSADYPLEDVVIRNRDKVYGVWLCNVCEEAVRLVEG